MFQRMFHSGLQNITKLVIYNLLVKAHTMIPLYVVGIKE